LRWELSDDEELVADEGFEDVSDPYEVVKEREYVTVRESLSTYPPLGYPIFSELIRDYIKLKEGTVRGRGYLVVEDGITYFSPLPHVVDLPVFTRLPEHEEALKELIRRAGYSVPYVEITGRLRFIGKKRLPLLDVKDIELTKPPKVRTLSFNEYEELVLDGIDVKLELRDLYLLHPISSPGLKLPRNPIPPGLHATYVGKYVNVVSWILSNYHPSRVTKYFRLVKTSLRRFKRVRRILAEVDTFVRSSSLSKFVNSAPDVDFLIIVDECPSSKDLAKDLLSVRYGYDITNYLLTTRLTSPYPVITRDTVNRVNECANALARAVSRANIPKYLIGKGKFLDLTYFGKPATVLRLAQSMIRAGIKNDLRSAINASMDALLATIKAIEDGISTGEFFKRHPEVLHDEVLILELVEDIEASKGCATIKDIKKELRARFKDLILERHLRMILESLTRRGRLIYLMSREGKCYKVVPD